MAQVTVDEVLGDAQVLLGDAAGAITQNLLTFYRMAYMELIQMLIKINAQEVTREIYYTLPAYTNVVFPEQLGATDFAEPQQIWERGAVNQVEIATITDGNPISVQLTAPMPDGLGTHIEINNSPAPPTVNRDWYITPTGADTFTLNGSYALGFTSPAAGGNVMFSAQTFQPMQNVDVMPLSQTPALNLVLGSWRWTENAIYVPGSTEDRQLWIQYLANDTAPEVGTIGLCEGRERGFLAYATAARFAMGARQMPVGPGYMLTAYGPKGEADGSGGLLRQLLVPILRQQQQLPRRMEPIRPRRGIAPVIG